MRTDAHTDSGIVFIFANVVFLGVSYMTYCREMIHTKNAVRERVKLGLGTGLMYVKPGPKTDWH
jgi:hypothetical protein